MIKLSFAAVCLAGALSVSAATAADTALLRYVAPFVGTTNFGTTKDRKSVV